MINGWYCRSITTDEDAMAPVTDHNLDYKNRYKKLKRKFKFLIYENEFLADTLRSSQKNFLKISRDRTFLLDRLLQYEPTDLTSSDSNNDDTETSDEDDVPMPKKKKDVSYQRPVMALPAKRKRIVQKKASSVPPIDNIPTTTTADIMTTEEVERHLQSRQSNLIELLPDRVAPTVPTEMFEDSEHGHEYITGLKS